MLPSACKLTGPVQSSCPDHETVVLSCDRSLRWPIGFALLGLAMVALAVWMPPAMMLWFFGPACLIAGFYFAILRADVVLSKRSRTLELRHRFPFGAGKTVFVLPFDAIREFLVESEFLLGVREDSAFVWHLTAITLDSQGHRLTWHFTHDPVFSAGQEAARITGKPLREERDPTKSSTWSHWGYNFLR